MGFGDKTRFRGLACNKWLDHLVPAGKDTSFNVLVSWVGIKLVEGHLLLKFAVFPVGTKGNTVSRVTLTPLQVNIPPSLQEVATSQVTLKALESNLSEELNYPNPQVLISECFACSPLVWIIKVWLYLSMSVIWSPYLWNKILFSLFSFWQSCCFSLTCSLTHLISSFRAVQRQLRKNGKSYHGHLTPYTSALDFTGKKLALSFIAHKLVDGQRSPPPTSTKCHSRDRCSPFFALFCFRVLYWAQTEEQKWGRPGNEAM